MISKVGQNGNRSTQEQLRTDHIETLELLQKYKLENARLKKELKNNRRIEDIEEAPECDKEEQSNIDIGALVEQNIKQADEIKLLKSRINQADLELLKTKQASGAALQAGAFTVAEKHKKRENEMTSAVLELENSLRTAQSELRELDTFRNKCEELEKMNKELTIQSIEYQNQHNKTNETLTILENTCKTAKTEQLRQELEISALHKLNLNLKHNMDANQIKSQQKIIFLKEQNQQYEQNTTEMHDSMKKLQYDIENISQERTDLRSTVESLRSTIYNMKESGRGSGGGTVVYADSDVESYKDGSTFQFTAPPAAVVVPVVVTTAKPSTSPIRASTPSPEGGGEGFRFQEYLRLKRENKELKLRLAEISPLSHSLQQQQQQSSINNNYTSTTTTPANRPYSSQSPRPNTITTGTSSSTNTGKRNGHTAFPVSQSVPAGLSSKGSTGSLLSPLSPHRQQSQSQLLRSNGSGQTSSKNKPYVGVNTGKAGAGNSSMPAKLRNNMSQKFF